MKEFRTIQSQILAMNGFDRFEINMNCLNLMRIKLLFHDKLIHKDQNQIYKSIKENKELINEIMKVKGCHNIVVFQNKQIESICNSN